MTHPDGTASGFPEGFPRPRVTNNKDADQAERGEDWPLATAWNCWKQQRGGAGAYPTPVRTPNHPHNRPSARTPCMTTPI